MDQRSETGTSPESSPRVELRSQFHEVRVPRCVALSRPRALTRREGTKSHNVVLVRSLEAEPDADEK
jgi:hypothetical protein